MAQAKKRKKRGDSPAPELTQLREQRAWDMRCANHTQQEIANVLGVNVSTVSRALDRVRKREYAEFASTREQHKIDQTRQVEHIASQAMRAWEKSKEPLVRARQTTDADGREVTINDVVERSGDSGYLYLVLKCMKDIRDIWGFEVLPASQDVGSTLAGVLRNLDDKATRYKAEIEAAGRPGHTAGADGADPV